MAISKGANMLTVRRENRASILKLINDNGPTSRKDIADTLGLTQAAVTLICNDLLKEGILFETGINVKNSGAGRRKVLLDINYNVAYVYAISIESQYTTIAISNLKGEKIAIEKIKTDTNLSEDKFLLSVSKICKKLEKEYLSLDKKIVAAGVGITGIVDKQNGISKHAYGIWDKEVKISKILEKKLLVPVYVENNVNAFALAELIYGIGREYDNLMVIKWGPGVGCSLIIDQEIYEGRHSKAAELGHFIIDKNGEKCKCGRRGCLETKVSYKALCKIKTFKEDNFGEVYQKVIDKKEGKAFNDAIDNFARIIINSATIMAPNRIILTGILFKDEIIRDELIKKCMDYDKGWGKNRILYSSLSNRESYIGPVAVCAKRLLFS